MMTRFPHSCLALLIACAAVGLAGCSSDSKSTPAAPAATAGANTSGGANTNGGAGNAQGGVNSAGGDTSLPSAGTSPVSGGAPNVNVTITPSGIPATATTGVAKPSGSAANLKVLDWAGFKGAVTFTFDDTQPSQVDVLPQLNATGVRMTFYANPSQDWYSGYGAAWKGAVAAGHEIGNHTMNHCLPDGTGCPMPTVVPLATGDLEVDKCSDYIKALFKQSDVWTMAYPFGSAAWEPYAKARFFLARGVSSGSVAPNDSTDPLMLPTMAAAGLEKASVFNAYTDKARADGKWVNYLFHSILPTTNNWYAGVDIAEILGSINYSKGLPDVWTDSMVNIGAYWLGQKAVVAGVAAGGTNWTWVLPDHFPTGKYVRVTVDGGTLQQGNTLLQWDPHGYYEVSLDAKTLTWNP